MNSLVVTLERVLGNETIAELLTTNKLLELACLALYVMYEKKQGKKSFWYPYIRELDRQRGDSLMWNLRFYENKKIKVVVIRIDSPEGDALASDLMWRKFKLLAKSKPIIASISDVAASGGYYMAMAARAIVAEKLALTGSIRVITDLKKQIFLKKSAQNAYKQFRDKAALSRSMLITLVE